MPCDFSLIRAKVVEKKVFYFFLYFFFHAIDYGIDYVTRLVLHPIDKVNIGYTFAKERKIQDKKC